MKKNVKLIVSLVICLFLLMTSVSAAGWPFEKKPAQGLKPEPAKPTYQPRTQSDHNDMLKSIKEGKWLRFLFKDNKKTKD